MIARLLISPSQNARVIVIEEELKKIDLTRNHPDLLYFPSGEKLGIAEARKIKEHFSFKPYSAKGRAVIIENAGDLTKESQNALLKTIEELPKEAVLILGASSNANILPTILSRCEIVNLEATSDDTLVYHSKFIQDLEKLLNSSLEERFEYIEKLKDREGFLHSMVYFFRQQMIESAMQTKPHLVRLEDFLKELLRSEEWAKQNVNIRAILEYLMLVMPQKI